MRKTDSLQEFNALRSALNAERKALQERLQQINAVLGVTEAPLPSRDRTSVRSQLPRGRAANTMSIRQGVAKATAKKALTVREIVEAMQGFGYQFTSTNPVNSLGAYLYSNGKKHFRKVDGKFSPLESSQENAIANGGASLPKRKRTMSPEARKKISAATKKRWAKLKAAKK